MERLLLVMIWLGVASFSLAQGGGNLFYLLFGSVAVGINLLASQKGKEVYLQRIFVNACVLLATANLFIETFFSSTSLLLALGHYLILIQLCKLFERKTNRDYVQMMILSMLLMVAAALTASQFWFAILLAVYLVLASYTAIVFTLKRGLDAASRARLAIESKPMALRQVAWNVIRGWPSGAIKKQLVLSISIMVVFALAAFIFMPREASSAKGTFGIQSDNLSSGFNTTINLGSTKSIYLSDKVVMLVNVKVPPNQKGPLVKGVYLRGKTFNSYADSTWKNQPFLSSIRPSMILSIDKNMLKNTVKQEISMVPSMAPDLFAIYPAVHFESTTVQYKNDFSQIVSSPKATNRPLRYKVLSWPQPLTKDQMNYLATIQAAIDGDRYSLSNIKVTRQVGELAEKWCADLLQKRVAGQADRDHIDLAIAERIKKRLEEDYSYSLEFHDADPSRDGVEDFLFHLKQGHCEYFASALTVMCRHLGVQARLAAGFRVDSVNLNGDSSIVREKDAHAWAEVYTHSTDWIVVDPSPRLRYPQTAGWLAGIEDFWQRLQFSWFDRVMSYDGSFLEKFSLKIKDVASTLWVKIKQMPGNLVQSWENFLLMGEVDAFLFISAIIVAIFGIGLAALIIILQMRRNIRLYRARFEKIGLTPKQVKFILNLHTLLKKYGLSQRPSQTSLDLAHEAAVVLDLPKDTLVELTELYYRLRWGRLAPQSQEISMAQTQVGQLGKVLAKRK